MELDMQKTPSYASVIIVGVTLRKRWSWYVSDYDYWFLDLSGTCSELDDISKDERFGIEVVDEHNADQFLPLMSKYLVTTEDLRNNVFSIGPITAWDDISEWCPSLLIDFDRKYLGSLFPEPSSFESQVPPGWVGKYENFLKKVPPEHRYWVNKDHDLFSSFIS